MGVGAGVEFKEKNNLRPWLDEGFLMELQSSESLIGAERSTNKVGSTHMPGKLVLVVGKRSQFFTTQTSPQGC